MIPSPGVSRLAFDRVAPSVPVRPAAGMALLSAVSPASES